MATGCEDGAGTATARGAEPSDLGVGDGDPFEDRLFAGVSSSSSGVGFFFAFLFPDGDADFFPDDFFLADFDLGVGDFFGFAFSSLASSLSLDLALDDTLFFAFGVGDSSSSEDFDDFFASGDGDSSSSAETFFLDFGFGVSSSSLDDFDDFFLAFGVGESSSSLDAFEDFFFGAGDFFAVFFLGVGDFSGDADSTAFAFGYSSLSCA